MIGIKFKGKRLDNGEWVEGTYHHCIGPGKMRFYDYQNGNRVSEERDVEFNSHWILVPNRPDERGWDVKDTYSAHAVIPETVRQFLGLHDKHNNDIYDGAILRGKFGTGIGGVSTKYKEFNFSVSLRIGGGGVASIINMPKEYGRYRFCPHISECVVIGNIHENPELLNQ